jgi:hypothetical protein
MIRVLLWPLPEPQRLETLTAMEKKLSWMESEYELLPLRNLSPEEGDMLSAEFHSLFKKLAEHLRSEIRKQPNALNKG